MRAPTGCRPRFVVLNAMMFAVVIAAWRGGLLAAVPVLGGLELVMLGALALYAGIGFCAAWRGRWETAAHIANGVPMFALGCTGLGMLLAVNGMHSLTPAAMAVVFRNMAFSITPNILGVLLMSWLREIVWWCGGETI